jgi:hypothetical protein
MSDPVLLEATRFEKPANGGGVKFGRHIANEGGESTKCASYFAMDGTVSISSQDLLTTCGIPLTLHVSFAESRGALVMSGTVRVFDFEIDLHGAYVTTRRDRLCPACLSDGEIDAQIKLLKDDLTAVAVRMKSAVKKQKSQPLF